jgi:hypothetical protein
MLTRFFFVVVIGALSGCCTVDRPCVTGVPPDRAREITRLVRDWMGLQLVSCARYYEEGYAETYYVTTPHGRAFKVYYLRDHWAISGV